MPLPNPQHYTIEDIYSLPEGERAELIDGKLYMMAPPSYLHQTLCMELSATIRDYIRSNNGSCQVLTSAAPPETISKEDFRKEIKNINDILKNPEEPAEKKGLLLRSIVDRIVYEKASGTMYFDFFVS